MAYQDRFYTAGAVTVQNGSAIVTGDGTGWETALIDGGVIFVGGGSYPIYSVESETSLTLAYPYVGVDGAQLPYAIDRQRAAATSNIQMNDRLAQIIREISIGNIEQFNALTLQANKILHTNASKLLIQSDITAAALSLLNLSGTPVADRLPYLNGASGASLTPLTAVARNLLDDTTTAGQRATIGSNRPAFRAFYPSNVGLANGDYYLTIPSTSLNVGNLWSGSQFTCNEAGIYRFDCNFVTAGGASNTGTIVASIDVGTSTAGSSAKTKDNFFDPIFASTVVRLNVGDIVRFKLSMTGLSGSVEMLAARSAATGVLIG